MTTFGDLSPLNLPPLPDFEAMTVDELGEWKRNRRDAGGALWRLEVQAANRVQDAKIAAEALAEATRQIERVAGETGETVEATARAWLTDDQLGRQVQARLYLGMPRVGREG